ncbi:MAG: CoA transferase subunit A [Pelotomaculum sp.]|uniref:Acyl CoA:acetate/3-ketoacid CoA transferase, alpha subunit n=1 Tax=Pelotomaculum thermopropionicum (strain DSM 13744 / JCM 10971 / SI) TaxID=370438 RepID=A5D5M7_PELTS|nr:CoA transferase subunit A [Pelotomaculum sp.]BAF58449.1 acyl CoA:acetate/3-ketoacid CoA transferase, alpha subunit [Pelotomaculum thermopropionicum SI]
MVKIMNADEAIKFVKSGQRVMIGGFGMVGTPDQLIEALSRAEVKDLVIIGNDLGAANKGIGKVLLQGKIKKAVGSYFTPNPDAARLYSEGKLEVELIPQGNYAEAIRAGGVGLGPFYTPTGAGTIYARNKETRIFDGKEYILEHPIRGDVALIRAHRADRLGNLVYRKAGRNFNPLMAMAADICIAEVDEIVEAGELSPEEIVTPFIFVDILVPRS